MPNDSIATFTHSERLSMSVELVQFVVNQVFLGSTDESAARRKMYVSVIHFSIFLPRKCFFEVPSTIIVRECDLWGSSSASPSDTIINRSASSSTYSHLSPNKGTFTYNVLIKALAKTR